MLDETTSKQNANLEAEEIDAMGQENPVKAVKWVQEVEKRKEKEEQEVVAKDLDLLTKKTRFKKNDYFHALYQLAKKELKEYEVPPNYNIDVTLKENGTLIFGIQKIGFRWFAQGMKPCGDPHYDMNCVKRLVVRSMLALDELQLQHEKHQTKSGIILPH